VARLGLEEHVRFLGEVDHDTALREMASATLFVNPSWTEGLPTTVLEAAAMGCTVVATDVGGTAEIVDNGATGWLVPARDPGALVVALETAVSDPEREARAAKLGEITRERFSWQRTITEFSAMLVGDGRDRSAR
jgi:glycosyltransferase involved in cell wall biosynthesis